MKNFIRKKIKDGIETWEFIAQQMRKAYDEVYGCEELSEEFNKEISNRKEDNKEKFISFVAGVYTFEAARKGIMLNEEIAKDLAEQRFYHELEKGTFDSLYNVKGEKNEC